MLHLFENVVVVDFSYPRSPAPLFVLFPFHPILIDKIDVYTHIMLFSYREGSWDLLCFEGSAHFGDSRNFQ